MNLKQRKLLAGFILIGSMLMSTFSFWVYSVIKSPNVLVDAEDRVIYIEPHTPFNALRDTLHRQGVINDMVSFAFVSKIMKYQERVKPGKYLLRKNMSNIEAIRLLRSGEQESVNIQFSNARYLEELAGKLTEGLRADSVKMRELLKNDSVANAYGFTSHNFMNMFLPNTYRFYWLSDEQKILDRMKYEYDAFWNEKRIARLEEIGMSKNEVSVLASIVDAETVKPDEKRRVAGVYINRLRKKMPLQADPTLVYAVGDFSIKRVLDKHKEIISEYNTYKNLGLPPGPIRLPSLLAIDAVLNYEKHEFIYFCAKEDFSGYHNFARTLTEHNRNAKKYHLALNRNSIYK